MEWRIEVITCKTRQAVFIRIAFDVKPEQILIATDDAYTWIQIFEEYKILLLKINQKTDFSDEQIEEFDDQQYKWCQLMIKKLGSDFITIYFHDYLYGHNIWFLERYRNLYKYNQTAVEASVGVVRAFFCKTRQFWTCRDGKESCNIDGFSDHVYVT